MPVLLLAQGDTIARDALRKCIEARYGTRPPALDTLRMDFEGRTYAKRGVTGAWVPIRMVACFNFPTAMRCDFSMIPPKRPAQHGIEAFDGTYYCCVRNDRPPEIVFDTDSVMSIRRRMWAIASIMLTPLSDITVTLTTTGSHSFRAYNTQLRDSVEVFTRHDHTIERVEVACLNPDTGRVQNHVIRVSKDLVCIDGLLMPSRILMAWDDLPILELEPVGVTVNLHLSESFFTLV